MYINVTHSCRQPYEEQCELSRYCTEVLIHSSAAADFYVSIRIGIPKTPSSLGEWVNKVNKTQNRLCVTNDDCMIEIREFSD